MYGRFEPKYEVRSSPLSSFWVCSTHSCSTQDKRKRSSSFYTLISLNSNIPFLCRNACEFCVQCRLRPSMSFSLSLSLSHTLLTLPFFNRMPPPLHNLTTKRSVSVCFVFSVDSLILSGKMTISFSQHNNTAGFMICVVII